MELRQIKEFYTVNGTFRSPSVTEDNLNLCWDDANGVFRYKKDVFVVSAAKESGTNRAEFTMSDDSKIYLELGQLAWASSVTYPVTSVHGRTGDIVGANGDYDASQITNAFNTLFNTLDDINEGLVNFHFTQADIDEIQDNTDARHGHDNKTILDGITDSGGGIIPTALQIATWDAYGTLTDQQIRDVVAALIQNGTGISWSYDGTTLTPTVSLEPFTTDNLAEGDTNLYAQTGENGNVRTIKLIAGSSVAERIVSPIELPLGWTLEEDAEPKNLLITHNLGSGIVSVSVYSVDEAEETLLIGNEAYSGLKTTVDTLIIEGLATNPTPISIYITIE